MPCFSRKTLPELFTRTYGFGIGTSGLAYLGLGVGFLTSAVVGVRFSDKVYAHYRAKNNGVGKPEMRIPVLIAGSLFIPVGLLYVRHLYSNGWQSLTNFTVGMDGLLMLGFIGSCPSLVLEFMALALWPACEDELKSLANVPIADPIPSLPITLYLIDSFTYAASATSATNVFRKCVFNSTVIPRC